MGYISPVSTLVKYFPDRRGLATGLAIMGFGLGSLIYGPADGIFIGGLSPIHGLYGLGVWYMLVMVGVAQYLKKPEGDTAGSGSKYAVKAKEDLAQMGVGEAIRTPRFYFMWLMLFINVACGIAIISSASPLLEENLGMEPVEAAAIVGLMGLFNGGGRLLWASVSDYLGRTNTYLAFFVIQMVAFFFLSITSVLLFQIVLFHYDLLRRWFCHYPRLHR